MDTSPIPGFITRRQASERCQRAERTLQRYWSRAIEIRDTSILEHLKLRAEDGQTVEGPEVTKELIEDLKRRRQNPTWYVHAEWVEKTYGPRSDDDAAAVKPAGSERPPSLQETVVRGGDTDMVAVLREQLDKREEEIAYLRDELQIKNEQIRDANARTRESNVLMQELQKMLADWQQQAFRSLPAADRAVGQESVESRPASQPHDAAIGTPRKSEKGSRRQRGGARNARPSSPLTSTRKTQPPTKPSEEREPTILEKHTPTLHKAFTRLFRR